MAKNPFGKKGLKFTTKQSERVKRTRLFVVAFLAFVLVFGSISGFMLFHMYQENGGNFFAPADTTEPITQDNAESVEFVLPEVSGKANFLLVCGDEENGALYCASVVEVDMDRVRVRVSPLDSGEQATAAGITRTFAQQYTYGGVLQIKKAAQERYGIQIDKYLSASPAAFKKIFDKLGGSVEIDLPAAVEYKSTDYSLSLSAGVQSVNAETVLKLLRAPVSSQAQNRAAVICAIFDQMLVADTIAKAESLFPDLIDEVESDISALDFQNHTDALQVLARSDKRGSAEVVQDPAVFRAGE